MPKNDTRFPTVPEVKLKARRVVQQQNLTRKYNRKPKPRSTVIFHHAEDYVKQHRATGRSRVFQRKAVKSFHSLRARTATTGAVAVVILYQRFAHSFAFFPIHSYFSSRKNVAMSDQPRKILTKLRLTRAGDTTFLKLTPSNRTLLKKIEPYTTYGIPSVETVRLLLEKFGCCRSGQKRIPITNNSMIERYFLDKGIDDGSVICLEDLVHEISTGGAHFDDVIGFLEPIQLRGSDFKYTKLPTLFSKGGTRGDRGTQINDFIAHFLGK